MIRQLVLLGAILFSALLVARGEGPEDRYVQIYNSIQEADALNDGGQAREAALKYFEAQKALKTLQAEYPNWNGTVVSFRLSYIASKLEPLAQKLPATNVPAGTNAPPATNASPATTQAEASPNEPGTNQFRQLQDEIKRLTTQNARLEAKLQEALSVQPALLDPRELAKAQEQIKLLQKEKELFKVSLEQEKAKREVQPTDSVLEQEKRILADAKEKLAQQTELAAALRLENDNLKKQLANIKPGEISPTAGDAAQRLQGANDTIATLQSSNLALRTEQILLASRVADLTRQLSKRGNSKVRPGEQSQQLETALARLAVYEAKPMPYSTEEQAVFKQPDLKANIGGPSPLKRTVKELPPGAGPIMEEAKRAAESGRLDEAEKKFLEVLRQDDKNLYTLGNLAAVQIEQNRLADAEKTISQALSIDARDPASLFTMGYLKFRQEKYDEALDALSLSASLIPDEPRTQYFLGKTLIQKGNRTAAEAALRKAVHLRPGWAEAHFSLATVYATQQPPFKELAQWHYQKAIVAGYPRSLEFEKLLEEKKPSVAEGK